MNGDLPSALQLATIAAATERSLPTSERLREALTLWREAEAFLKLERLKIEAAERCSQREIQRCNAENAKRRTEAIAHDKDPYGLRKLAPAGSVTADRFLKAVLPSVMSLGEQFENDPSNPDGPLVSRERKMKWRREQREAALRGFLCGDQPDYSRSTFENTVFVPRFPDGTMLLRTFSDGGLPVDQAIEFADEFRTFATMTRELDRDAGRRKGGAATKAKHAATKRARDPKRKPTSWERKTKSQKK